MGNQEGQTLSSIYEKIEHTVVPDIVSHGFGLIAPAVELTENGFHRTVARLLNRVDLVVRVMMVLRLITRAP